MASVQEFSTNEIELHREIKRRDDISELMRAHGFVAARRIQAWFRGLITRNHLRMLNNSATTIQRHWRGFVARRFSKSYLKDRVINMWWQYYNQCATKIQALWRGYRARENGVNLPKYRQWLQTVYDKNEQALTKMREFRNSETSYAKTVMEHESMLWILFILFKLHHLLRTKLQPGVLTRIDKTRFTVIEKMIRSLEYTSYVGKRCGDKCNRQPSDPPLLLQGTYFARCEKEIRDFERSIDIGKASIRRDAPYEDREKFLKSVEKLREKLISGNNGTKSPFRTVFKPETSRACDNSKVRVIVGDYNPPKSGFTPTRPPRDRSKELHGDFKTIIKPNELYEAINEMDCPFSQLKIKCPIHG